MKKDIIFMLPAQALEGATGAVVLGDFNNWTPSKEFQLKKQKDGSFKAVLSLEEGKTFQYRFLLDNGIWENDYDAQNYAPASGLYVENSVITVPVSSKDNLEPKAKVVSKADTAKPKAIETKPEKAVTTNTENAVTTNTEGAKGKKPTATKKIVAKSTKATSAAEKIKTKKVEKSGKPIKKEATQGKK